MEVKEEKTRENNKMTNTINIYSNMKAEFMPPEYNFKFFKPNDKGIVKKIERSKIPFETQKDIKMYDKEGYLLSVCGDVIPIKMKKVPGFKFYEVYTNKTNKDSRFDINIEAVPEILIGKNDKLKMKK